MGAVVGTLAELGYGWAYRCLDAQYFGLAQRRERVFIVGCLGDAARAAQVLFEPESGGGDSPPRRATGQGAARCAEDRARISGVDLYNLTATGPVAQTMTVAGGTNDTLHALVPMVAFPLDLRNATSQGGTVALVPAVATTLSRSYGKQIDSDATDTLIPSVAFWDSRGRQMGDKALEEQAFTLHAAKGQSEQQIVAYQCQGTNVGEMGTLRSGNGHVTGGVPFVAETIGFYPTGGTHGVSAVNDGSPALKVGSGLDIASSPAVLTGMAVRRLTPTECERLQGFPDGWTEGHSDSARYRMLGNAVAVPVITWIGHRIMQASRLTDLT